MWNFVCKEEGVAEEPLHAVSTMALSVRKLVREQLVCGICSDLLEEPKTLVCGHSFCKDCLIADCNIDLDASESSLEKVGNRVIECPYCLQITAECCINNLDTNTELEEMLESLSPEEIKAAREQLKRQHINIASLAEGHGEIATELCELHKLQHQYFCVDCNITACAECINDLHAVHCHSKISDFVVESLTQLRCLVQPSCTYVSRADTSLRKLIQDNESIDSNRDVCKEAVKEVFNKVRAAIDEREKMLLSSIDGYIDQKLLEVMQQKKNLMEVQDQLYQSIQEIEQILGGTLSDLALLADKHRLVEDIYVQEQNILDIENLMSKSMFSSTYIGFRDDCTDVIEQHIEALVRLCELYPDAGTGYYSSRLLPVHDTNALEEPEFRKRSSTCTKIVEEDELAEETTIESVRPTIKRSQSTPNAITKEMWLTKKRKHTASVTSVPSVPIRFDSLILPTPIVTPEKIFDKLAISKTESVYPCGICIGENNSFIISDVRNHCLRIIASNGKFIGAIGKEGKGSGQFEDPCAVAANEKAQIFACQRENPRIQKLTSGGKYIQKFGHKSLRGNTLGEPWGITIGADNKLYVTDWDKSCIHIFCNNGRYDCTIGNDDSILGESLKLPAGITMDTSLNLIVADRGNHCVWVLKPDGTILMCIGTKGHGPGELFLPYGVAVHPNGSIIVSESGNNRVSVFAPCGKFLKHFGQKGIEPGMFDYPRHVCVTPSGEIVVADEQNQRLQLFKNIL